MEFLYSGISYIEFYVDHQYSTNNRFVYTGESLFYIDVSSEVEQKFTYLHTGSTTIGFGVSSNYKSFRSTQKSPQIRISNTSYDSIDCPIAVIRQKNFSPNKIINIKKYDSLIYENTESYCEIETLTLDDTNTFPLNYYRNSIEENVDHIEDYVSYLMTNYINDDYDPLFYKYELMYDAFLLGDTDNISIFINGEEELNKSKYKIQYSYDLLEDTYLVADKGRYGSDVLWVDELDTTKDIHRVRFLLSKDIVVLDNYYQVRYTKHSNNINLTNSELIEAIPLYIQGNSSVINDFRVTDENLIINDDLFTDETIYLVKDTSNIITSDDLISIKTTKNQSDSVSSWILSLHKGSFRLPAGLYKTNQLFTLKDTSIVTPIQLVSPIMVNGNIIKLDYKNIYINNFTYPNYEVEFYKLENFDGIVNEGSFSIIRNGVLDETIKITSIDRNKGFIQLNTNINPNENIQVNYYMDKTNTLILEKLELNPKVAVKTNGIHINDYEHGIGIAIKSGIDQTYPFYYDLSSDISSRMCIPLLDIDDSTIATPVAWSSSFITICELNIKKMILDDIEIIDARRIGGGVNPEVSLIDWHTDKHREEQWYSETGFYDGEPLSNNGLIIIHIPSTKLNDMYTKWFNNGLYNGPTNEKALWVKKQSNYHLDRIIRKYIPAGSHYIIMDENFNIIKLEV